MIQNILTFCLKNDLTYVEGSLPSGKLVANDINRNSIYLITPYIEATIKANFQSNLQSDKPTSVVGILVNDKINVNEIVDEHETYYNLVKDWNIYEFKVPSTTLQFISRNRAGKIGINFSVEQRTIPTIKPSYGEYRGEIINGNFGYLNGYYINKTIGFEFEILELDINDLLVYNPELFITFKVPAYTYRGSSPTALYSVDPSVLNDNFETIEPSLTTQITEQVNANTGDIITINLTLSSVENDLVDLQNRMSVAESDIDIAENNIVNLQGRMATAESDIENIEDGTTIVEKALRDSLGNIIKDSYVSSVYPTYNDTTDKLFIETYDVQDGLLANNEVILPKATTTKNGLMAKEDKVKVDNIASDISSAITTHDNSATAHLPLRTLINDLQKEIDRLNAKGRSWGEIDLTFSQWIALTEPTRSNYINTFLANNFSGYIPSNGDLVYTIVSDTEEEHELEYNSTLSQWVDNGAYIVGKASNTQMGLVQGDLTYVSILNGLIQVLKSDYATNVGSSGSSYDYDDLLALFTEVANDIYKKNETYSNTEIEQRITDLLGLANLQDTAIEKSAGVFVFDNGDSLLATSLAQYNWVITRFYNVDGGVQNVRYNMFKPSEATSGNRTIVQIDRTPVRYAEIKRDNGNILFRVVDESDTFDNTYVCTMKMWGIKLDGINASEISYDGTISGLSSTNVKTAIDELASEKADKTYVDSQDLTKADKLVLTNLVSNGDLLNAKPSPNQNEPLGFNFTNSTNITLSGGIATYTPTAPNASISLSNTSIFNTNDKYYRFAMVKSTSTNFGYILPNNFYSKVGEWELLSSITSGNVNVIARLYEQKTSGFTPIEVDYIGAINLTAIFGAGNEPTKEQMDAIIKLKGFFQTTTIDLKDLMLLGFTQETRMTPTLTNATTTYLTYRKDDLGYVDIVGNLTITTFGTNFTFPSGYRPLTQLRLPILTSTNTLGYIIINTDGTVVSNANATIYINSRFATI